MRCQATGGRIVVGVDGSQASRRAAAWAAEEARTRGARLDVVLAWRLPAAAHAAPGFAPPPAEDLTTEGSIVDDVLSEIPTDGVAVSPRVCLGPPETVLRDMSRDPDVRVVVVGSHGRSRVAGRMLGSVSHYLTHHCAVPLVIVPEGRPPAGAGPGRVVVGVDGSSGGEAAFAWAAEEARCRRAVLDVVAAWSTMESPWPKGTVPGTPLREALPRAATEVVDRLVSGLADNDLVVERTVLEGTAADVLLDRASDADLLVLGSRGRARQVLLGSVSHECVRRAAVPIAIVR